jgi:hypothetical protein
MTLDERRTWLEKKVKHKLADQVWDELVSGRYACAGEMHAADEELLVEQALFALRVRRRGAARHKPEYEDSALSGLLTDRHQQRRHTLARCAASMAEDHPDVRSFRDEVLGDAFPLTYDQALRYVDTDGHVRGDAPGRSSGRLEALTKTLSETYRWKPHDASWFVLCAYYTPPVATFSVESEITHRDYGPEIGTITLTVEPWLPVEIVAEMYRNEQRRMIGRKPRQPSGKRLRLLEFVKMMGKGLSWRERMDSWNEWEALNADEEYTDRRNFGRAYNEVRGAVLEPGYAQQRRNDEHSRDERRRRIERTLRNAERDMKFILKADTI